MLWYLAEEYGLFRTDTPNKTKETGCHRQFVQNLLSQQWEHKKIGISYPKGLRMLSKARSKGALLKARQLAAKTEQYVVAFLERGEIHPSKEISSCPKLSLCTHSLFLS
jgi:hypothetical protein